jgi:hypothetical protein
MFAYVRIVVLVSGFGLYPAGFSCEVCPDLVWTWLFLSCFVGRTCVCTYQCISGEALSLYVCGLGVIILLTCYSLPWWVVP